LSKNNETRRGGILGRVPEFVRSAADNRILADDQPKRQDYVIRILPSGEYIEYYNPDLRAAGTLYPTGYARTTRDIQKAIRFRSAAAVLAFVFQQSKVTPFRPDGQPNRPLTAFKLLVEAVPPKFGRTP
jgi:hypothetical protein